MTKVFLHDKFNNDPEEITNLEYLLQLCTNGQRGPFINFLKELCPKSLLAFQVSYIHELKHVSYRDLVNKEIINRMK